MEQSIRQRNIVIDFDELPKQMQMEPTVKQVEKESSRENHSETLRGEEISAATSAAEETSEIQSITPERHQRDILMSNNKMRYVYSAIKRVQHDRECPCVAEIGDKNFRMRETFAEGWDYCPECYRQSLIRAGLPVDQSKSLNTYMEFFDSVGATDHDLLKLMIHNHAQLYFAGTDAVGIQVKEDKWKIACSKGELQLFHNNYRVAKDFTRVMTGEYHLQKCTKSADFASLVKHMCGYSWNKHINGFKKKRTKYQFLADLGNTANYVERRCFAADVSVFQFVDCDAQACGYLTRRGVSVLVLMAECTNERHKVMLVEISDKDNEKFIAAMHELKRYVVGHNYAEYVSKCRQFCCEHSEMGA